MNNNAFGYNFNALFYYISVFFKAERFHPALPVFFSKVGAIKNVKKLKLDSVCNAADIFNAFKHILFCFTGKPDNQMRYNVNAYIMQFFKCFVIYFKLISPSDIIRSFFMYALKPELNKNGLYLINILNQFKHPVGQTVGTGCY